MQAIIYKEYGASEVLQMVEVDKPSPNDNEVLIKMKATTVNSGDARLRRADPYFVRLVFGLFKPRQPVLGMTVAGEVEQVGKKGGHPDSGCGHYQRVAPRSVGVDDPEIKGNGRNPHPHKC